MCGTACTHQAYCYVQSRQLISDRCKSGELLLPEKDVTDMQVCMDAHDILHGSQLSLAGASSAESGLDGAG